MEEKIRAMKRLPIEDKEKLLETLPHGDDALENCVRNLSIFSQKTAFKTHGDYEYQEINGINVYYIPKFYSDLGVFLDDQGKILYFSKYYLNHFVWFMQSIDAVLERLEAFDLNQAFDIGENYVSICKWFITYGHFKDEAYSLGGFLEERPDLNQYKAILDYPTDDKLDTKDFKHNINYVKIDHLIFDQRSLNAYDSDHKVLKLRNLILIDNHIKSKIFHSFPITVSRRIKAQVSDARQTESSETRHTKLFITRSPSYRDLANRPEIESYLANLGFKVINPEHSTYEELVHSLSAANLVFIFYGSALTNLVYLPSGAKVVILKAASYLHENIILWQKVISAYEFSVREISAVDNVITLDEVRRAIGDLGQQT